MAIGQYYRKCGTSGGSMKSINIKNNVVLFDEDDSDFIFSHKWHIGGDGYVITYNQGKQKRLSRLLLKEENPNVLIDHINRNIYDNRKINLRKTNKQFNSFNEKPIRKNNTSGFKGVTWDKQTNKWAAQITITDKSIKLGRFANKNEAIKISITVVKPHFYDNDTTWQRLDGLCAS